MTLVQSIPELKQARDGHIRGGEVALAISADGRSATITPYLKHEHDNSWNEPLTIAAAQALLTEVLNGTFTVTLHARNGPDFLLTPKLAACPAPPCRQNYMFKTINAAAAPADAADV